MMKLPSASAGGTAPSGSSFAATKPGVFGSRVGGVGRGGAAGACAGAGAGAAGAVVWAPAELSAASTPIAMARLKCVLFIRVFEAVRRPTHDRVMDSNGRRRSRGRADQRILA